jgi:hypothetical protein
VDEIRALRNALGGLGSIPVGISTYPVTWAPPFPDATYIVIPTLVVGAAALGVLEATLQPGSKTAEGCTITVVNLSVAVIASAGLDVLGVRT